MVAAAALGSGRAGATEVSGWVGGSGTRFDAWTPPHDSSERLRLDAGLSASGFVFSPEDIDWRGNLQYGRNRASYTGSRADDSIFTFGGTAAAFDNRRSNFALRLGGSRSQSDLAQSGGGAELTGTSLTNTVTAQGKAGGGAYPRIDVDATWTDTTNSGLDRPDLRRTTKELDASAGHGGEGYSYQLFYRGRIEEGSLPSLDYASQTLGFDGRAQLSDRTELGLFGQHFTRTPRVSDGTNPKYDDTTLSASSLTTLPAYRIGTRYTFGHFLFESTAAPATERFNQNLTLTGDRALTPEWSVAPSIAFAYTQDRLGTTETSAAGQNAGASVRWSPRLRRGSLGIEAGARVGLLEPAEGATELGWGASTGARYGGTYGATQYGGAYRFDYDRNTNAIAGWTLNQSLSGDLSRQLASALSLASNLTVSAARSASPLAGDAASRSAQLSAALQWPSFVAMLSAGLADGVAGALSNPIRGDALFVPPNFQTHSRSVALTAVETFRRSLTLTGTIRYLSISGPDLPTQNELVYTARIGYRIGQFVLSLEDVYRTVGTRGVETRVNQVMFTFTRNFVL